MTNRASIEHKETCILNFFFGEERTKPITFEYQFDGLVSNVSNSSTIKFEMMNSMDHFSVENQFKEFNSMSNRQNVGHNYQACAETGKLKIIYPSFDSDRSYEFTERVNNFLQYTIAYILTFFQRRRVIFGCPKLTSGDKLVFAMAPFMAAELIDSVGYGEPLIPYASTEECLNSAIDKLSGCNDEELKKISMLLLRYNETLNLPYTYERIESYWRIMESLGEADNLTAYEQSEYERLKTYMGMRNNSKTLKKFVKTLVIYDLSYTDELVKNSFDYRNKTIHEYLSDTITNEPYLSEIFRFLNEAIERVILAHIGVSDTNYTKPKYSLIYNRVI